jgi:hypothetical protein
MRHIKIDGKLQVIAAASLLQHSQLVQWKRESATFIPVERETFESYAEAIDRSFGRLLSWISFAAGAEFLAKGVCLLHEIEIREAIMVPGYPIRNLDTWITNYQPNAPGTVSVTSFRTLGFLLNGAFKQLCTAANASQDEEKLLVAAYSLLARSIRNRDAHAYVPKVRDQHFALVAELFTKSFNLLISWIPDGNDALNSWLDDAPSFIGSL